MKKIITAYFLCFVLFVIGSFAQKVSNVNSLQDQNTIIITYRLETTQPCKINLYLSQDDGLSWKGPLKQVKGDVGDNITNGDHSISWMVLDEIVELKGSNIRFKVTPVNNNSLFAVKIGTQYWQAKNLDVTTYRNGESIPHVQDPVQWSKLTTGAWCYYENKLDHGDKYGKLYNWYAVNDSRGLAPDGYHIPSDLEWEILINSLGGESKAGILMKSRFGWNNNGNGTGNVGFDGLPGGDRNSSGSFYNLGVNGSWWSSTKSLTTFAWNRFLYCEYGVAYRGNTEKTCGLSVRCLKD